MAQDMIDRDYRLLMERI